MLLQQGQNYFAVTSSLASLKNNSIGGAGLVVVFTVLRAHLCCGVFVVVNSCQGFVGVNSLCSC